MDLFARGWIDLRSHSMWTLAKRAHSSDTPISDQLGLAIAIASVYPCFGIVLLLLECLQGVCDELYGFPWEVFTSCVEAPIGEEHYTFDLYAVSMQELVERRCLRLCYIVGWTVCYMFWETFGAWMRSGVCYLGLWDGSAVHDLSCILAVRCYRVVDTASWEIGTGSYEAPRSSCRVSLYRGACRSRGRYPAVAVNRTRFGLQTTMHENAC